MFSVGSVTDKNNPKCWRRIRETWYRIKSGSDTVDADIATKCVEVLRCGTIYPIWINGKFLAISGSSGGRSRNF